MLTNYTNRLTNLGGSSVDPATVANTLTVANQAARLALTYGTGTGQVQELDQVLQTSDSTLWVLLANDPSVSGNWSRLPGNDASALTTGTLPAARYTSSPTTNNLLKYNGTVLENSRLSDDGTNVTLASGRLNFTSGGTYSATGNWISSYGNGISIGASNYAAFYIGSSTGAYIGYVGCFLYASSVAKANLQSTGLAINKSTTAASRMLEVVDSAAAQLRLTHTAATDYADFAVDTDGILTLTPSGTHMISAKNLRFASGKFIDLNSGGGAPGSSDYGIGINGSYLAFQVGSGSVGSRFYGGSTCLASIAGLGIGVGLGATNPSACFHARSTDDQLWLERSSGIETKFKTDSDGNLGITPSGGKVIVTGTMVTATATPASAGATGTAGQWAWDGSYIYIATATNTWKRVAIATWP